jgi:catechol 2,3-dioxygenase-like lactoylglutathione lyase family enzyme
VPRHAAQLRQGRRVIGSMSIKSVAHVCIKSSDLDATTEFYCGALGMKRIFDFTRQGKIIGFYLKAANETFIEVFHADEVEKIGKQVLNHFCLEVDSIEAVRQSLVERGYTAREIKLGCDQSYQFWMKDPNGMDIEFHEYTPKSTQITGGVVEVDW